MSSSGYTAITFVANEQPTTAKWNLIGSNDASFNSGNGFEDGIIVNRHLANNAVGAANLATNAITLYKNNNLSHTTSSATPADMTNGSQTVTVPAGGRSVLIFLVLQPGGSAANLFEWFILADGVQLNTGRRPLNGTGGWTDTISPWAYHSAPSAGSHTYKIQTDKATGSGSITTSGFWLIMLI